LLQFKFRSQFNRSAIQAEIQIFAFFQSTKAALRDVRWGTLEENCAAQELNLLEIISIYQLKLFSIFLVAEKNALIFYP